MVSQPNPRSPNPRSRCTRGEPTRGSVRLGWNDIGRSSPPGQPDPRAGIFGPASTSWKIHRESAFFLAAGRAALLQLAHPWVATAIAHHSSVLNDPVARFHNTFRVVFTMFFGTLNQALASLPPSVPTPYRNSRQLPETVAAYPRGSALSSQRSQCSPLGLRHADRQRRAGL